MPGMSAHATAAAAAWTLISLRPQGEHAPLRRAAARVGARLLAVSPWRLQACDDAATRTALALALAAPRVIFSSPAAVHAAAALQPLAAAPGQCWLAVGTGTARALQRHGIAEVAVPERMDSDGLLALPQLAARDGAVGLVTAPGGRGLIAAQLQARGTPLQRADVYRRVPLPLSAARIARLRAAAPGVLALSSGEALRLVLDQLPEDLAAAWRARPLVAASARLAAQAADLGFVNIARAAGPLPQQLAAAAAAIVTRSPLR
ncbi:uroporphyrinogen-III synthase [Xanthomonas cerealis pv. cerealis]|nr:uroporphyrinogen-III synthase [Xanthomonas translucens]UKE47070.1 uroporphyrinogen-III synthase [Xanthomonas translucens pv. cerealis]UKE69404.1 uroporphyrinogen-III synthase [Xanthomonas translucens pv. pistacia]